MATGDANAFDDIDRVHALLVEMYPPNSIQYWEAQDALQERAKSLVNQHWDAITALAKALWASDWLHQVTVTKCREKHMTGEEIAGLLRQFGISAKKPGCGGCCLPLLLDEYSIS